jgi:hypothetical protein
MLRQTMIVFEEFFFGDHVIEKNRFEACWRRLDDFHKTVQQLMVFMLLVLLIGCQTDPGIETAYGRRAGKPGGPSVNGTGVLADMFERAGYRVTTARYLGRLVKKAPLIVWFPDDHDLPSDDVRRFFAEWLAPENDRTLVYVGRDFNAEISYWRAMLSRADADDAVEYRRRAAHARSVWDSTMSSLSETDECTWFEIDRSELPRRVDSLEGLWSEGIDASQTDIWLHGRLAVPSEDEIDLGWQAIPLLSSEGEVLAAEVSQSNGGSRVIVVNNGSWLLNLPLVNHEHRKLAGRLIERCGAPSQVVFVESNEYGPQVADSGRRKHHGLEAFTAWPLNCILLHVTVLGILYCFSVFPIFGRPKRLPARDKSDFGRHITALGDLLAKTNDQQFAKAQVAQYHQLAGDGVAAEVVSTVTAAVNPFAQEDNQHAPSASRKNA